MRGFKFESERSCHGLWHKKVKLDESPLLFVLFVNDMPIVLERCQILMYADDTVMCFTASNAQEISSTLTSELAKVNDWLVDNSLFIHPGKTECVLFGTGSRLATTNLSVNIHGKELTRVAEYKYLGVILDESLSWNAHVNYLISKVSKRIVNSWPHQAEY